MKFFCLLLAAFVAPVFSQTAEFRQGDFVDQYEINDPGNASGFDNHLLYFLHQVNEVVVQLSSANATTFSEALLCWDDPDITECPDDDIGGGIFRMPALVFLAEIQDAASVTYGADLSLAEERLVYLAFWHEYRTKDLISDSLARMDVEELNDLQKKRGLQMVFFAQGIAIEPALLMGEARVEEGTITVYTDYGLEILLYNRRLLSLLGAAGPFDD